MKIKQRHAKRYFNAIVKFLQAEKFEVHKVYKVTFTVYFIGTDYGLTVKQLEDGDIKVTEIDFDFDSYGIKAEKITSFKKLKAEVDQAQRVKQIHSEVAEAFQDYEDSLA